MFPCRLRLFGISWLALLALGLTTALRAGPFDWPQWGGPDRNAMSKTALVQVRVPNKGAFRAEEVYSTQKMATSYGGMILSDGYLYGSIGDMLACVEWKTGDVVWKERTPGKGSVAWADGHFYYRNERTGTIFLVKPSPKGYLEQGRLEQPERSKRSAWPHPVIANGRLYLRDHDLLVCYDLKPK